ncbi:MAG TPA: S24 family peptidase [Acidiferrobacteraceae bacterium]|nr:S24 family peptidase [Acidiferrobacteraceae bacterium]
MSQSGCSAENSEPYVLQVMGDSMEPEFKDGHVIIVDPGSPCKDGVYMVVDYGGEVIFGQYAVENGRKWLRYLNPDHKQIELIPPFEIKGVVIQRAGRRRRDHKHYDYMESFNRPDSV